MQKVSTVNLQDARDGVPAVCNVNTHYLNICAQKCRDVPSWLCARLYKCSAELLGVFKAWEGGCNYTGRERQRERERPCLLRKLPKLSSRATLMPNQRCFPRKVLRLCFLLCLILPRRRRDISNG